jgi:hypothetical protein
VGKEVFAVSITTFRWAKGWSRREQKVIMKKCSRTKFSNNKED